MCNYCDGTKVLLEGSEGIGFFIDKDVMTIIEQVNSDSYIIDKINIDYCPKCGRNLFEI